MAARNLAAILVWAIVVHATALTPVVLASGYDDLANAFVGCVAIFFHAITVTFLSTRDAVGSDRAKAVAYYLIFETFGAVLIDLGSDGSIVARVGGWMHGLGIILGPLAGWVWLTHRRDITDYAATKDAAQMEQDTLDGSVEPPNEP